MAQFFARLSAGRMAAASVLAFSLAATPPLAAAGELADLSTAALNNDLQLKIAESQRNAVLESKAISGGALLPSVGLGGGLTRTTVTKANSQSVISSSQGGGAVVAGNNQSYQSTYYGASVQQSLFDLEALQAYRKSGVDTEQAELTYTSAVQDLYSRFLASYFTVQSAQSTLETDANLVLSNERELERQKKSLSAGLATTSDVLTAEAALNSAKAALIADQTARFSADGALRLITGTVAPATRQLRVDIPLLPVTPLNVDYWTDAAYAGNIEIKIARKVLRGAELQRKSIAAAFYPKITGVGSYSSNNTDLNNSGDSSSYYYGVNASLALFNGGSTSARLRQADENIAAATKKLELTVAQVKSNVVLYFNGILSGIESVKAAQRAVEANEANVVAFEVSSKVGARSVTDSIVARNNLAQAQRSFYTAKLRYLDNLISLKAATGGLGVRDVMDLDSLFTESMASY